MEISGVISAIVIGLIIGLLGRLVLPGRQHIGVLWTIAVGIVAALIGSAIAEGLDLNDTDGVDWIEWLIQIALAAAGWPPSTGPRSAAEAPPFPAVGPRTGSPPGTAAARSPGRPGHGGRRRSPHGSRGAAAHLARPRTGQIFRSSSSGDGSRCRGRMRSS